MRTSTVESPRFLIRPVVLLRGSVGVSIGLFLLNLAGIYLKKVLLLDSFAVNTLYFFFDASSEANIPTLFSTLVLFVATVCLFITYSAVAKITGTRIYWAALTLIFLFLTVDEAATIHEQFNKYNSDLGQNISWLHYTWVIPYAIFAAAAGTFFIKFLISLPASTRLLFVLAGSLYICSAIGFELLESQVVSQYGQGTTADKLFCAVEEFLEMSSICIFIYALLKYLEQFNVKLKIINT